MQVGQVCLKLYLAASATGACAEFRHRNRKPVAMAVYLSALWLA